MLPLWLGISLQSIDRTSEIDLGGSRSFSSNAFPSSCCICEANVSSRIWKQQKGYQYQKVVQKLIIRREGNNCFYVLRLPLTSLNKFRNLNLHVQVNKFPRPRLRLKRIIKLPTLLPHHHIIVSFMKLDKINKSSTILILYCFLSILLLFGYMDATRAFSSHLIFHIKYMSKQQQSQSHRMKDSWITNLD